MCPSSCSRLLASSQVMAQFLSPPRPLHEGHEGQLRASAGCLPQDSSGPALCPPRQGHETQAQGSSTGTPTRPALWPSGSSRSAPTCPDPGRQWATISSHPSALSSRAPREESTAQALTCERAGRGGRLRWGSGAPPPRGPGQLPGQLGTRGPARWQRGCGHDTQGV